MTCYAKDDLESCNYIYLSYCHDTCKELGLEISAAYFSNDTVVPTSICTATCKVSEINDNTTCNYCTDYTTCNPCVGNGFYLLEKMCYIQCLEDYVYVYGENKCLQICPTTTLANGTQVQMYDTDQLCGINCTTDSSGNKVYLDTHIKTGSCKRKCSEEGEVKIDIDVGNICRAYCLDGQYINNFEEEGFCTELCTLNGVRTPSY